jgi:ribosomal protein S18 acetylase RimI-like enzyme
MTDILIKQCEAKEAYLTSLDIPEFEPWYSWEKWQERLEGKHMICLIATISGEKAGMKVGYFEDDHFYSWIGGVVPRFRRLGIAAMLANQQEALVSLEGTPRIRMKTRNKFTAMLQFALGRGFYISRVDQQGEIGDWRITLYKNL